MEVGDVACRNTTGKQSVRKLEKMQQNGKNKNLSNKEKDNNVQACKML